MCAVRSEHRAVTATMQVVLLVLFLAQYKDRIYVSGRAGGGGGGETPTSFIQLRDRRFRGEDRVLRAELARRMEARGGRRALPPPALGPAALRRLDALAAARDVSPPWPPRRVARRAAPGSNRSLSARRSALDPNRTNRAFIYSANRRMSLALSLQLMEQAVYTVQYRFKDVRPYTKKFAEDRRYRISFLLRMMDDWFQEMRVWHHWLSGKSDYSTDELATYHSLLYYQFIVRNHVDITQTWFEVIALHEAHINFTKHH